MSQANAGPIGVAYFLHTQPDAPVIDAIGPLHVFGSLAGNLLGRIVAHPESGWHSARPTGQLHRNVVGLERSMVHHDRPTIRLNSVVIDPTQEQVTIGKTCIPLSETEFGVLYLLVEKRGTIVSQHTLLREVWGEGFVPQGNVVEVCVHRLRRKLATIPQSYGLIRTVRGQGFIVQSGRW